MDSKLNRKDHDEDDYSEPDNDTDFNNELACDIRPTPKAHSSEGKSEDCNTQPLDSPPEGDISDGSDIVFGSDIDADLACIIHPTLPPLDIPMCKSTQTSIEPCGMSVAKGKPSKASIIAVQESANEKPLLVKPGLIETRFKHETYCDDFASFWKDSATPVLMYYDQKGGFDVLEQRTQHMFMNIAVEFEKLNILCAKFGIDSYIMSDFINLVGDEQLKKNRKKVSRAGGKLRLSPGRTPKSYAPEIAKQLKDYRFVFVFMLRQVTVESQILKIVNLIILDGHKGLMWYYDSMYTKTINAPRPIARLAAAMSHRIHHTWTVKAHIAVYDEDARVFHLFNTFWALVQAIRYGVLPVLEQYLVEDFPPSDSDTNEEVSGEDCEEHDKAVQFEWQSLTNDNYGDDEAPLDLLRCALLGSLTDFELENIVPTNSPIPSEDALSKGLHIVETDEENVTFIEDLDGSFAIKSDLPVPPQEVLLVYEEDEDGRITPISTAIVLTEDEADCVADTGEKEPHVVGIWPAEHGHSRPEEIIVLSADESLPTYIVTKELCLPTPVNNSTEVREDEELTNVPHDAPCSGITKDYVPPMYEPFPDALIHIPADNDSVVEELNVSEDNEVLSDELISDGAAGKSDVSDHDTFDDSMTVGDLSFDELNASVIEHVKSIENDEMSAKGPSLPNYQAWNDELQANKLDISVSGYESAGDSDGWEPDCDRDLMCEIGGSGKHPPAPVMLMPTLKSIPEDREPSSDEDILQEASSPSSEDSGSEYIPGKVSKWRKGKYTSEQTSNPEFTESAWELEEGTLSDESSETDLDDDYVPGMAKRERRLIHKLAKPESSSDDEELFKPRPQKVHEKWSQRAGAMSSRPVDSDSDWLEEFVKENLPRKRERIRERIYMAMLKKRELQRAYDTDTDTAPEDVE